MEFGSVGFWERGKPEYQEKNLLEHRERTNNKLNPHVALTPGFEPDLIISKKSTRTHIHGEASFKRNYKSMALLLLG